MRGRVSMVAQVEAAVCVWDGENSQGDEYSSYWVVKISNSKIVRFPARLLQQNTH